MTLSIRYIQYGLSAPVRGMDVFCSLPIANADPENFRKQSYIDITIECCVYLKADELYMARKNMGKSKVEKKHSKSKTRTEA